ncbi:MAG: hypothetical protein AB7J28_11560 [Hyphomonadaceae bacterium]
MLDILVAALLAVAAGEPKPAATEQLPPAETADPAVRRSDARAAAREVALDEVTCRQTHQLGTRIPRRLCMTRREQIEIRTRQQAEMRRGTMPVGNTVFAAPDGGN